MLPGAEPHDASPEFNYYGSVVARVREWSYPELSTIERALRWHDRIWEIQYDRNVPLRALPGNEAKAPPSPRTLLREGQVQPRTESDQETRVMEFDSYAAHFALTPERQAERDRRMRHDLERSASKEAEIEAKRVAHQSERV